MTEIILDKAHYHRLVAGEIPLARKFLWIASADLKDLHVQHGRRFVPFVDVLAGLVRDGVEIRLIHAKEPGPRFRADFDRNPELLNDERFERLLCVRNHMKIIIIDGRIAYTGSANLTGAGLGAKGDHRRNFEAGLLTDDPALISPLMDAIDTLWRGEHCRTCQRRDVCPDPVC